MRSYEFNRGVNVSKIGIKRVSDYLLTLPDTSDVINVEYLKEFQELDIDMVLVTNNDVINIEVKCDTYETGNFFFETTSNSSKDTEGCFMYTQADYIYYFFVKSSTLYKLPMPLVREWFVKNIDLFRRSELRTKVGKEFYSTIGYIVPIRKVLECIHEVEQVVI